MVLFADAANSDFTIVKRNLGLPERLLSRIVCGGSGFLDSRIS
jgi:hypothetical protein